MNYEKSLEELEKIVAALETGEVTLEKGVELFEKGVALTKECLLSLNEYKGKIASVRGEVDALLLETTE